jgi:hypothetical protein
MNAERQVRKVLRDAGATLARQRKHMIFRFRNGSIWVCPSTASDCRAWRYNLAHLRRRLGLRMAKAARPVQFVNEPDPKSDRKVWREYIDSEGIRSLEVRA